MAVAPAWPDNDADRVVASLRQAGFEEAGRTGGGSLAFGLVACSFFQGLSPQRDVQHVP
jgi:hypothetical protein